MSDKDFLSQFSDQNKKPDSFKEEVRIPVNKEKKPLNPMMIVIPVIVLIIVAALAWFFMFRPTIEVPYFIGKKQSDVASWVSQQGITKSGIIFNEEYSLEYEDGEIFFQSIEAGKKVKKDVKMTFTMSKGADPDEEIAFPDIMSMTLDELNAWKKDNKLNATKITTTYSDEVAQGEVISFNLKGCEQSNFTRGCNLNISVSKGQAPAGTITVSDFKNNPLSAVEAWAKTNKIELNVVHSFDDEITSGSVISTSPEANKRIAQGEVLTVIVSQGKGIKVPDFAKMSNKQIDKWLEENSAYVNVSEVHSSASKYIISQSVATGNMIGMENKLEIKLNLGSTFYLNEITNSSIVGMKYDELVDICNENRYKGIDAYAGEWNNESVYSDKYEKGRIVSVECQGYSDGKVYSCDGKLPLDVRFSVVVSKGKVSEIDIKSAKVSNDAYDTAKLVSILADRGITFENKTSGETCTLQINGQNVNADIIRVIQEEDRIVLADSDAKLPEPTLPEGNN